jgi:hypothetical protein
MKVERNFFISTDHFDRIALRKRLDVRLAGSRGAWEVWEIKKQKGGKL